MVWKIFGKNKKKDIEESVEIDPLEDDYSSSYHPVPASNGGTTYIKMYKNYKKFEKEMIEKQDAQKQSLEEIIKERNKKEVKKVNEFDAIIKETKSTEEAIWNVLTTIKDFYKTYEKFFESKKIVIESSDIYIAKLEFTHSDDYINYNLDDLLVAFSWGNYEMSIYCSTDIEVEEIKPALWDITHIIKENVGGAGARKDAIAQNIYQELSEEVFDHLDYDENKKKLKFAEVLARHTNELKYHDQGFFRSQLFEELLLKAFGRVGSSKKSKLEIFNIKKYNDTNYEVSKYDTELAPVYLEILRKEYESSNNWLRLLLEKRKNIIEQINDSLKFQNPKDLKMK